MSSVEQLFTRKTRKRQSERKIDEYVEGGAEGKAKENDIVSAIQSLIDSNQIVIFSKSYCPFCRQVKMALRSVPNLEFEVVELDDGGHENWQRNVSRIAKNLAIEEAADNNTVSVPQIFIEKQYIGGADDLADMFADNRLATMLGRPLYPSQSRMQ